MSYQYRITMNNFNLMSESPQIFENTYVQLWMNTALKRLIWIYLLTFCKKGLFLHNWQRIHLGIRSIYRTWTRAELPREVSVILCQSVWPKTKPLSRAFSCLFRSSISAHLTCKINNLEQFLKLRARYVSLIRVL